MSTVTDRVRQLLRAGTCFSFLVLIVAVTIQVVGRSFLGNPPVWTEELTRFALLYLAGFGTGLAFLSGDLVNVDLVSESLPAPLPWLLRLIAASLVILFCLLTLSPAMRFTAIGAMQTSPAMALPMNYVHGSMLLLLSVLALAAVLRVIGMLTRATDGKPEHMLGDIE